MEEMVDAVVTKAVKSASTSEWTFTDNVIGFYHAVNWRQTWLQGVLAGHILLLMLIVMTRKHFSAQAVLFAVICCAVFGAERLNSALQRNWQSFADQDYFDAHGVFISAIFSAPLLTIGLLQVILMLKTTSDLLIQAKILELGKGKRTSAETKKKQ